MKIGSIIIILFSYMGVVGQIHNAIPPKWEKYLYDHKVTLTKVNFLVNDTTIPYTLIQEPWGSLSFIEGHRFSEDTINFEYLFFNYQHLKENKDTLIPNVVFNKNYKVLELNDLFSHFSLKHGGVLYTYDFDYKFYPYFHELKYSYVYCKTGTINLSEMDTDTIIRLTNLNLSPFTKQPMVTIYELTPGSRLKEIKIMNYSVDTLQNFILTKEEIIYLKKSEIKSLNKSFKYCLAEDIKYSTKTKMDNPFLIEIKLGNYYDIIERNEGVDGDGSKHYSDFQTFVSHVNQFGRIPSDKIEKRKEKYK